MPDIPGAAIEYRIKAVRIEKRLNVVRGAIYAEAQPIAGWRQRPTGRRHGPEAPPKSGWRDFKVGARWGGADVTTWFTAKVTIPRAWAGRRVVADLAPGGEALLYVNGEARQGLDGNHSEVLLAEQAAGGERLELLLEAYSGIRDPQTFARANLCVVNEPAREYCYDALAAYDAAFVQPQESAEWLRLFDLLDRSTQAVDLQHIGEPAYFESIGRAREILRAGLKDFRNPGGPGRMALVGHTHIDTAWLWPLRETRRKCGRTYGTALRLMEQHPEFIFSQGQLQLYEFMKEHYPALYEQIKQRVKEGRWEIIGGTWVEHDCNLPSGESFVRQLLYGKRFARREFGVEVRAAWLPDTFGFAWTLPQLFKRAGIDCMYTTKISWNQYNRHPYDMFWWVGPDGSRVLTHLVHWSYNGNPRPSDLRRCWDRFSGKLLCDEMIFSYGWGDGGGGPTAEMLEYSRRLKDMAGVPRTALSRVHDFFDRARQNVDLEALPVWNDELYLELHRGCQTTQAWTKRHNRKCELLYREAELFGALAIPDGLKYPAADLWEGWKRLLTNQFHDILPGSSIAMVYEDTEKDYALVRRIGERARADALRALASGVDTRGPGAPIVVFNSLSWERHDVARVTLARADEDFHIMNEAGEAAPHQVVGRGGKLEVIFEANGVPAMGYRTFYMVGGKQPAKTALKATRRLLENDFLRVKVEADGTLGSVFDKCAGREALAAGTRGNDLLCFDDRPNGNDAWDVEEGYELKQWRVREVESLELVEAGPVRAVIRVVKRFQHSTITQDITLHSNLPRVDFVTRADWHEKHVLLKCAFPVEIQATRATYELQYGAIERPTHRNTSWDRARFEVPGQRWSDLSEGDYGVSLMNDCKYGWDTYNNVMRLSLLRSPESPDPHADEGRHEFTYSLYPHAGTWREGETVQRAYELNAPLAARVERRHSGERPAKLSFCAVDQAHVVVDAVKRAEDSEAVVVRVYEAHGQRGPVALHFERSLRKATECNLLEESDEPVEHDDRQIRFSIRPWEVRTFKVVFD